MPDEKTPTEKSTEARHSGRWLCVFIAFFGGVTLVGAGVARSPVVAAVVLLVVALMFIFAVLRVMTCRFHILIEQRQQHHDQMFPPTKPDEGGSLPSAPITTAARCRHPKMTVSNRYWTTWRPRSSS